MIPSNIEKIRNKLFIVVRNQDNIIVEKKVYDKKTYLDDIKKFKKDGTFLKNTKRTPLTHVAEYVSKIKETKF